LNQEKKIVPITMPGIHERFYRFLKPVLQEFNHPEILEVGAGHGAFTRKLWKDGYAVSACDLFPEIFYFDKIECRKVDISRELPYPDQSFDIILAVEVMEHIHDHNLFFKECNRILKKGGLLIFSTPNILSLKSRLRFLFTGFYYSFKPLDHHNTDGLQHIASLTVDQYNNLAITNGLQPYRLSFDKRQSTSRLLSFLIPFLWVVSKIKSVPYSIHNHYDLLTARILFYTYKKPSD
jgi:SAM-dependent methyltransferase